MEFKVVQKEIQLQSRGWIPTFHDISREVQEIVKQSGVINGTCAAYSSAAAKPSPSRMAFWMQVNSLTSTSLTGTTFVHAAVSSM